MNDTRRTGGYTITELVVVLSVISILSLVIVNFFGTALMQNAVTTARAELLNQAHFALDAINDDVRLSARVDEQNRWADMYAPGAPEDELSWTSGATAMVLATIAEDEDRNVLFEDAAEYISWKNNRIYFLEGGALYRRTLAAEIPDNAAITTCPEAFATSECPRDQLLLENISHFSIRYFDGSNQEVGPAEARSVELEIELQKRAFGRDITVSYTTRMVFRNA